VMTKSFDPFNLFGRTVAYASSGDGLNRRTIKLIGSNYSARYFISRFLGVEGVLRPVGKTSLLAIVTTYGRLARDADLLVTRLSPHMSRLMAGGDVLRIPERVTFSMQLPPSETTLKKIRHSQSSNLRIIKKNNFSYKITNKKEDIENFYYNMYKPFVDNRFDDNVRLLSFEQSLQIFRRGALMWALQDGRIVAGNLIAAEGQTARSVVFGTVDGRREPVAAGALSALYYFSIEWACEEGFTQLDLGGSRPSLSNGALRTKHRWGAELVRRNVQFDLIVHWRQWSDHIGEFLSRTPLIFRDEADLSGIVAMTPLSDQTLKGVYEQARKNWVPGLKRLIVITDLAKSLECGSQYSGLDIPVWITPPSGPRNCVQAARPMVRP